MIGRPMPRQEFLELSQPAYEDVELDWESDLPPAPSPEEIAKRSAAVRQEWTDHERRKQNVEAWVPW